VYIFGPPGLDPSRLSLHATWILDFPLGGQVRSLSEQLFAHKQYELKTSLNSK